MNSPTSSSNLHNYLPWCLFRWCSQSLHEQPLHIPTPSSPTYSQCQDQTREYSIEKSARNSFITGIIKNNSVQYSNYSWQCHKVHKSWQGKRCLLFLCEEKCLHKCIIRDNWLIHRRNCYWDTVSQNLAVKEKITDDDNDGFLSV